MKKEKDYTRKINDEIKELKITRQNLWIMLKEDVNKIDDINDDTYNEMITSIKKTLHSIDISYHEIKVLNFIENKEEGSYEDYEY